MTYTYENARKIVRVYNYLIGKYLEEGTGITDICIVPDGPDQMADFLEYYQTENADNSLLLSGFDKDQVRIVVVREQTTTAPSFMLDLDIYLSQKNIEKIYDTNGAIIQG